MTETNVGTTEFVGGDFKAMPGISLFGAFARIIRINHIQPAGYHEALALKNRRTADLSLRLTFGSGRESIAASLGLSSPDSLHFSQWLPFTCNEYVFEKNWTFRFCPHCLRLGFHSYLQQLPWIGACPWHRCAFRTLCRICETRLKLESTSGLSLLMCRNGHDHFDEIASCTETFKLENLARSYVDEYLSWSAEQRNKWELLSPDASTTDPRALTSVVHLPQALRDRCTVIASRATLDHSRAFTASAPTLHGITDIRSSFAKVADILNKGLGIELPRTYIPGFGAIACDLADALPPGSLTYTEKDLFFNGLERQPSNFFQPAHRPSLSDIEFLPPLHVGERRIVHLSSLGPKATSAVAKLIAFYLNGAISTDSSSEEDDMRLIVHTTGEILKRAYAEGVRTILARYIPALFDSKRNRPRLTEPWILVGRINKQLFEIRVVWAKANPST